MQMAMLNENVTNPSHRGVVYSSRWRFPQYEIGERIRKHADDHERQRKTRTTIFSIFTVHENRRLEGMLTRMTTA